MSEFGIAWNITAGHEGGLSLNPDDYGNFYNSELIGTKYGITATYYYSVTGRNISRQKMANLTKSQAGDIARAGAWTKYSLDSIPLQYIANQIFDILFHFSFSTASRIIQLSVLQAGGNLNQYGQDNKFGSETLKAIIDLCKTGKGEELNNSLVAQRIIFYNSRVLQNSNMTVFIKGWLSRAKDYLVSPAKITAGLMIGAAVTIYLLYNKK